MRLATLLNAAFPGLGMSPLDVITVGNEGANRSIGFALVNRIWLSELLPRVHVIPKVSHTSGRARHVKRALWASWNEEIRDLDPTLI